MSQRTIPSSAGRPFEKAYPTANATDTSFASRPDALAEPSGDGVVDLRPTGLDPVVPTWVELLPYGTGDANDVFVMRVYGVRQIGRPAESWTYVPLLEVTCTLGTKTGVAGGGLAAAEMYCDTIVAASPSFGVADNSYRLSSPADNSAGRILLDTEGYQKLRIDFDTTTGNPTGANCLYAGV